MPQHSNKDLEALVKATGKRLRNPPSSVDELLSLLDRTEVLLTKVQQSPAKSMFAALSPLMNALLSEKLLKHSDVDVKVGVASCISEITRITAPEAPYDDDKMKDVFQLIVFTFRDISDTSSRSHQKRATILETVAKVRSCVVMLDLECDQLVIEMFQHFLKAIRDNHAELIFSCMEAIMTLVLEESEDISPDLLDPILSTLKKNKAVRPIAKKLAERVVRCCADKLRPYLPQALKALDARLEDYSEVVASVCCGNNGSAAHCNENILTDQSVIESKSTSSPVGSPSQVVKESTEETNPQDLDLNTQRSPKSTVANGVEETRIDETMADANFSKKADSDNASDANLVSKAESGDMGDEELVKMEAKVDQTADIKGKQLNSENDSAESSDAGDSVKKQSEQVPCNEEETFSGAMKKRRLGNKLLVEKPKKESESIEEDELKNDGDNGSGSERKSDQTEKLKVSDEENVSGGKKPQKTSSVTKKQKRSGKKQPAKKAKKESALIEEVDSKNGGGSSSDSEAKSLDLTEKLRDAMKRKGGESQSRKEGGKKSGAKPVPEKDVSETSAREDDGEDMVTSPRSPLKSTKDEGSKVKTPKMSTKRKRTPGTGKAYGASEFGENLVGSKVKVWWPKDLAFYEGVVHSFDSAKKKHKVVYVDGDEEVLNLKREKWEFLGDEGKAVEHSCDDASSDMKKKKTGLSSDKSKSKDTATKSKGKSKDDDKIEPNTKSKSSNKSEDETIKSKDRLQKLSDAKVSGKSEDSDVAAKSNKGKTPQSGKNNLASAMTNSSSSKVKETDKAKDKKVDSAKSSSKVKWTDKVKDKEMDSPKSIEIGKGKSQDSNAKSEKKRKR